MNSLYNLSLKGIFIFILCQPILLFSQSHNSLEISLNHLEQKREILDLTTTDISNYRISDLYTSKHNGVTHIYLQQQHEEIDLQNAIININVLPNGKILNSGNRFSPDLANKINSSSPSIKPIAWLYYFLLFRYRYHHQIHKHQLGSNTYPKS